MMRQMLCALLGIALSISALGGAQAGAGTTVDQEHRRIGREVLGPIDVDWLTTGEAFPARVVESTSARHIELTNGLVARTLDVGRGGRTVALIDERDDTNHLRAPRPKGANDSTVFAQSALQPVARLVVDGVTHDLGPGASALVLSEVELGAPLERLTWRRTRHASPFAAWPPRGVRITLVYSPVEEGADGLPPSDVPRGLHVRVHHELYDGVPLFGKFVEVGIGPRRRVIRTPRSVDGPGVPRFGAVPSRSGAGPFPMAAPSAPSAGPTEEVVGGTGTFGRCPRIAVPTTRARTPRCAGGRALLGAARSRSRPGLRGPTALFTVDLHLGPAPQSRP